MATTTRYKAKLIAQTCSFDRVPAEIIEQHIFIYFCFKNWLQFALVSRRWKHICESAKIAPKHLKLKGRIKLVKALYFIRKYQPSILTIDYQKCAEGTSIYSNKLKLLIDASPRLDTLIISKYNGQFISSMPIEGITTLALVESYSWERRNDHLCKAFPNLQYLQLGYHPATKAEFDGFKALKSVFIDHVYDSDIQQAFALTKKDITVTCTGNKVYRNGVEERGKMSYEQYFRYFGETKLQTSLYAKEYNTAAHLLDSETSAEYEEYLHSDLSYKFPTVKRRHDNPSRKYRWTIATDQEAYDLLVRTNKIPLSNDMKFCALVTLDCIDEAVSMVSKINWCECSGKFLQMLNSPLITPKDLKRPEMKAFAKILCKHTHITEHIKTIYQWSNVRVLLEDQDWSNSFASVADVELLIQMIKDGCKIPYDKLRYHTHPDLAFKLVENDPNQLYLLSSASPYLYDYVSEKYKISPIDELNGTSLCNSWVRAGNINKKFIKPYINHMDSNGDTPLSTLLNGKNITSYLETILKMEADPNLHRGDKLSPLALALKYVSNSNSTEEIWVIATMALYGADMNAPCLFEQRMCSPLMIAVRLKLKFKFIKLLIGLGARTDYIDETGRTIREYAKETGVYSDWQLTLLTKNVI